MHTSQCVNSDQSGTSRSEESLQSVGNGDRIRLKYGAYHIEIIENDSCIRVSKLYSIDAGVKTIRTFAVVAYPDIIEPAFQKEHDAIMNGQSIGIVFKNNGWSIDKRHQYFGEIGAPADYSGIYPADGETSITPPAIHIYALFVEKENTRFQYASIAEVHHPEYLQLEDLNAIYGNEFDSGVILNQGLKEFLEVVRTKMRDA